MSDTAVERPPCTDLSGFNHKELETLYRDACNSLNHAINEIAAANAREVELRKDISDKRRTD